MEEWVWEGLGQKHRFHRFYKQSLSVHVLGVFLISLPLTVMNFWPPHYNTVPEHIMAHNLHLLSPLAIPVSTKTS